jgi:hypothetical protein
MTATLQLAFITFYLRSISNVAPKKGPTRERSGLLAFTLWSKVAMC